jgi:hypothetical protein
VGPVQLNEVMPFVVSKVRGSEVRFDNLVLDHLPSSAALQKYLNKVNVGALPRKSAAAEFVHGEGQGIIINDLPVHKLGSETYLSAQNATVEVLDDGTKISRLMRDSSDLLEAQRSNTAAVSRYLQSIGGDVDAYRAAYARLKQVNREIFMIGQPGIRTVWSPPR